MGQYEKKMAADINLVSGLKSVFVWFRFVVRSKIPVLFILPNLFITFPYFYKRFYNFITTYENTAMLTTYKLLTATIIKYNIYVFALTL